ncbi:MAG: metal-dependent transcriptional regulator, partial [Chitinophagaceae bacterium]
AEELEHITSKKLIDKLEEYLDFPQADPHGDPIPDGQGRMPINKHINLAELPVNVLSEISNIGDQSPEIMELMNHNKIKIGTRLEVKRKFNFDNSIEIKLRSQPAFTISEHLAKNLFVKYDDSPAKRIKIESPLTPGVKNPKEEPGI